ncbi:heavy metal translocating P-type ATPase [Roseococcus pinisoli]|nr:heavy metal translocating P-type ATPase [Roseococcus pinisoli]
MSEKLVWRVEGMDCGSCVASLTRALEKMPGIADIEVNLMAERLTASLSTARPEEVERQVAALGFTATALSAASPEAPAQAHSHHDHDDPADAEKPWWATGKAKLTWLLGGLVGAAWALSLVLPETLTYPLFLVATGVALVPFGRRAIALARSGSPFSIETLMCTAAIGAALIGAAEEAAVVVLLFALGEMLEGVAAGRARAGIRALASLMPRTALRVTAGGTEEVPAQRLVPGDLVLIRPGDRVPCDGSIEEGRSALDESPVSGESVPVARGPGELVRAGSINADGALRVRVTHAASDNTIARIIRMVEEATASRAPAQRFIERFAAWWTPSAMGVSLLVILGAPFLLGWDWSTSLYRGLAVLLIACPCALVISVPAAMASGLSAGARRGLLVKGGAALETIGAARHIAFDKTGTLTEGRPRVTDLIPAEGRSESELLALAAAVEQGSAHPLARAILAEADARGLSLPPARDAAAVPGKAVRAQVAGREIAVGSPRHAAEAGAALGALAGELARLEAEGKTVSVALIDGALLGLIALRDEPRADAASGIAALTALGVRSVMLTGDNARTGAAIASGLGLDVQAELLPEDKLRAIAALAAEGPVAMVGDGINDAPALAAATVGIAMGGGTDVALETADAAVLRDRVTGVAELISLSRATMSNVKQNVAVAVGLKGVFLITTLAGVTGLWPAILADTGATVLVTLNALRLLGWRPAA